MSRAGVGICVGCRRRIRRVAQQRCSRCYKRWMYERACPECGQVKVLYCRGVCKRCWRNAYGTPVIPIARVSPRSDDDEAEIRRRLPLYEARAAQCLPLF